MIYSKSWSELQTMDRCNAIVLDILRRLKEQIEPGVTTADLDRMAEEWTEHAGALPAFKGYRGYPATLCTSINEQIVHGIPGPRVLNEGDIIGIDMGVILDGYYGDSARTFPVGKIEPEVQRLLDVTREAMHKGIEQAVAGKRIGDIGHAIQSHVEAAGFSVVRDLVGHGIGRQLHEDPQVPNYGRPGKGLKLELGQCLAIEPMVNLGRPDVETKGDGWTVVTSDHAPSSHYEHTIVVTRGQPMILTA